MPLNIASSIFDADPEAVVPKPPRVGPAFKVKHYDWQPQGTKGAPDRIPGWGILVDDPDTADALKELFGGTVREIDDARWGLFLVTDVKKLDTVITDFISDFRLYNGNKLIHHCDGFKFLSDPGRKDTTGKPLNVGDPCGCPPKVEDRIEAANGGWGPKPYIKATFELVADRGLGSGVMTSDKWPLRGQIESYVGAQLAKAQHDDPADEIFAQLVHKEVVGKKFTWDVVAIEDVKALNEAVAEGR